MSETTSLGIEPMDEHNRALIENVHPPDWVNPESTGKYNLVVIGAGTAGLITAAGAAGLGARVALIERHLMGGDCLNVGCVPSKGLLRAARAVGAVRDAGEFGVRVPEGVSVDFPAVMERMRRIRAQISPNDSVKRFSELGIDMFMGSGEFLDSETIAVDGKKLKFAKAAITTGGRAVAPAIPGLAEAGYLTNETIFNLTQLPPRLAVIGGGPIGCEMSQSFCRFGSDVTLIGAAGHILIREDADAAAIVQKAFIRDGINLQLDSKVIRVETRGTDKVISIETPGGEQEIIVDEILVGVGRAPNVDGMGLEKAGVEFDKFGVKVGEDLVTSNPRIFAAGDVCFKFKFTHTADALARILIQNALFPGPNKKTSALTIPWCTYTDPEIAHVGMYEKDAQEQGIEVETLVQEFADVDRAILDGDDYGIAKVHLKRGTDRILGATIVTAHAGEMISELSTAIVHGIGLGKMSSVIHPYPTQADAIRRLSDAYNRTRLTPLVASIFEKIMRWGRRG
ncbi:MAG: mercuric reductase [Verrucomicrobia bacterium]|nr:mercuric reductase [Verrucomicrobiota bacterium]MDA1087193.1 mercuric reductase [Verrucomicrobiota bacterium]